MVSRLQMLSTLSLAVLTVVTLPRGVDSFTLTPSPAWISSEASSVVLRCQSDVTDLKSCLWYEPAGEVHIVNFDNYRAKGGHITHADGVGEESLRSDCVIQINNVQSTDLGDWKCTASSVDAVTGDSVTLTQVVSLARATEPKTVRLSSPYDAGEITVNNLEQPEPVQCVVKAMPQPEFDWYLDDELVGSSADDVQIVESEASVDLPTWTHTFDLQPVLAAKSSGKVRCVINHVGLPQVVEAAVYMRLQKDNALSAEEPTVVWTPIQSRANFVPAVIAGAVLLIVVIVGLLFSIYKVKAKASSAGISDIVAGNSSKILVEDAPKNGGILETDLESGDQVGDVTDASDGNDLGASGTLDIVRRFIRVLAHIRMADGNAVNVNQTGDEQPEDESSDTSTVSSRRKLRNILKLFKRNSPPAVAESAETGEAIEVETKVVEYEPDDKPAVVAEQDVPNPPVVDKVSETVA